MSQHATPTIRDELIEWSQPLIVDQINYFYFHSLRQRASAARELAIEHYRVWRHVLRNEMQEASDLRSHLGTHAASLGIPAQMLDDVDRAVLDELMDVVVSRFPPDAPDRPVLRHDAASTPQQVLRARGRPGPDVESPFGCYTGWRRCDSRTAPHWTCPLAHNWSPQQGSRAERRVALAEGPWRTGVPAVRLCRHRQDDAGKAPG